MAVWCKLSCWAHSLHFTEKHFFKTVLRMCGIARGDFVSGNCNKEANGEMIRTIDHACKSHFHSVLAVTCHNHTLVRHAVGGHVDVFAKKKPSLENRLVFAIRPCVGEMKNPHEPRGHGRGGVPNRFVFCILDLAQTRRSRIEVLGHPRNQHIPGARAGPDQEWHIRFWRRFCEAAQEQGLEVFLPEGIRLSDIEPLQLQP